MTTLSGNASMATNYGANLSRNFVLSSRFSTGLAGSTFIAAKPSSNLWGVSLRVQRGKNQAEDVMGKRYNSWRTSVPADLEEASVVNVRASGESFRTTKDLVINGNGAATSTATLLAERSPSPVTGGAYDFRRATEPLTARPLPAAKKVVLVRHGLSSWNEEERVQGSSDLSVLSEKGRDQALRVRESLAHLKFDQCFASPISRAKTSAELIWEGKTEPIVYLDTLREANLLFLEGMRNIDAKQQYPELFKAWREEPQSFHVDGVYPIVELWAKARKAWEEILSAQGELVLVVTHKSILRALLCTALGMGPDRFRAIDVNNAAVSVFTVNVRGEPMLQSLNMTAHLHADDVHYY